jgi:hypothetical protein
VDKHGDNTPANTDLLTTKRTIRWLWQQKQAYQFVHMALKRKRLAITQQETDALKQVAFFKNRIDKELKANPSLLPRDIREDQEGEGWRAAS